MKREEKKLKIIKKNNVLLLLKKKVTECNLTLILQEQVSLFLPI